MVEPSRKSESDLNASPSQTNNHSQNAGSANAHLFPDTISSAGESAPFVNTTPPQQRHYGMRQHDTMSSMAPPPQTNVEGNQPKENKPSVFNFFKGIGTGFMEGWSQAKEADRSKKEAEASTPPPVPPRPAKAAVNTPSVPPRSAKAKAAVNNPPEEKQETVPLASPRAENTQKTADLKSDGTKDSTPSFVSEKESKPMPSKESINSNLDNAKVSTEELCAQSKKIRKLEEQISALLQEEEPNMVELDRLLKDFFFRILKKMLINEHQIGLDELKILEEDIKNIRKTYNTVPEMFIGIASGAINAVSGLVGMGSAIAGFTGTVSENFLKQMGNLTNGASTFSRALDPIQSMIRSSNEEKRVVFNYQKDRDSGFKSATEAVVQAIRAVLNSHKSQTNNAEDALHQAFLRLSLVG